MKALKRPAPGMVVASAEVAGVHDPMQSLGNARIVGVSIGVVQHLVPNCARVGGPRRRRPQRVRDFVINAVFRILALDEKGAFGLRLVLRTMDEVRQAQRLRSTAAFA